MSEIHVEKSITMDVPRDKVGAIVSDFHQWPIWSPWLLMEPEASVDVASDGQSYTWEGTHIGAGSMAKVLENLPNEIMYELNFLKPFKSQAQVKFILDEDETGTQITWIMDSTLPFFLSFLKKMMVAVVGMDYERGLTMLKDYAETGSVPSRLVFTGETAFAGCSYVGTTTQCAIKDVGPSMEADFDRLLKDLQKAGIPHDNHSLSIYHDWDMVKGRVSYTGGVPVTDPPTNLPSEYVQGDIPKTNTYCIHHFGPYRHLGNAWSTGMSLARAKVIKQNKHIDPFEIYPTMPGDVDEKKIETRVHFPVG